MKKQKTKNKLQLALMLIAVLILFSISLAWAALNTKIKLEWDYPPEELPGITFYIYHSTNVSAPMPWTAITNVVGQTNVTIPLIPTGQHFYYCTASNAIFGESDPSNIAATGFAPRSGMNLKIQGLP